MEWGEWLKVIIKDLSDGYNLSDKQAKKLLKKILNSLKMKKEREE